MASAPTLNRLECGATPAQAAALHEVLMQQFIASHAKAPRDVGKRSAGLDLLASLDCFSGRDLQVDRVIRYPAGMELLDCEPFPIPEFSC